MDAIVPCAIETHVPHGMLKWTAEAKVPSWTAKRILRVALVDAVQTFVGEAGFVETNIFEDPALASTPTSVSVPPNRVAAVERTTTTRTTTTRRTPSRRSFRSCRISYSCVTDFDSATRTSRCRRRDAGRGAKVETLRWSEKRRRRRSSGLLVGSLMSQVRVRVIEDIVLTSKAALSCPPFNADGVNRFVVELGETPTTAGAPASLVASIRRWKRLAKALRDLLHSISENIQSLTPSMRGALALLQAKTPGGLERRRRRRRGRREGQGRRERGRYANRSVEQQGSDNIRPTIRLTRPVSLVRNSDRC